MKIKQRKTIPDPTTQATIPPNGDGNPEGRNPHLQGIRLDVFLFVQSNPHCTRADIVTALKLRSSSATARVRELIDEGLLYEPGKRKRNKSGVMSKTLLVSPAGTAGRARDRVVVNVEIRIDSAGNYYADAQVVGGVHWDDAQGRMIKLMDKDITIMVPKLEELHTSPAAGTVTKMERLSVEDAKSLTIDADFTIIEGDKS